MGIGLRNIDLTRVTVLAIWASTSLVWVVVLIAVNIGRTDSWLLDWHVYAAGGRDFLNGTLYSIPLKSAYELPVSAFNYPPLSAISVIPLLVFPDAVGGTTWVVLNILAIAGTAVLGAKILGASQPVLWGAIGFLAYTVHPWMRLAFLGNNTPVVLFLVTAFAYEHLRSRDRSAGVLLGAAIAFKLWPVALIPLLIRDRRWHSVASAAVFCGFLALVTLAWLGPEVIGPAARAMQVKAIINSDNPVFYTSWLRETQSWWPSWGSFAVAAILVAIPARGLLGIGLGILGGVALVPNIWRTYISTLLVAAAFVVRDLSQRLNSYGDRVQPLPSSLERAVQPAELLDDHP
jgi:hypothetical protein